MRSRRARNRGRDARAPRKNHRTNKPEMYDKAQAKRVEVCQAAQRMLACGRTMGECCLALEVGRSTLERWLMKWRNGGEEALASGRHACGRKPLAEAVPEAFAERPVGAPVATTVHG